MNELRSVPVQKWYTRQEVVTHFGIAWPIQAKVARKEKIKLVPNPDGKENDRAVGYTWELLMKFLRAYGYTEVRLLDRSPAVAARVFKLVGKI